MKSDRHTITFHGIISAMIERTTHLRTLTAPGVTRSMRAALRDLRLEEIVVVHAGSRSYNLDRKIRAIALDRILEDVPALR